MIVVVLRHEEFNVFVNGRRLSGVLKLEAQKPTQKSICLWTIIQDGDLIFASSVAPHRFFNDECVVYIWEGGYGN